MTAKSLNDFISSVKNGGIARSNRFSVLLVPPTKLESDYNTTQLVQLFCEQAVLPSLNYSSQPVKTFGEDREVIYDRNFEDITLTFYVDHKMNVKAFFDNWASLIISPVTRLVGFYEEYIGKIHIYTQDLEDNNNYVVSIHEAYPKTIGAVQVDNNSKDIMKLSVTFTYKYHINTQIPLSGGEPNILNAFSLVDDYSLYNDIDYTNYAKRYKSGSLKLPIDIPDSYFQTFNNYQKTVSESLSVQKAIAFLERNSSQTGTGGSIVSDF